MKRLIHYRLQRCSQLTHVIPNELSRFCSRRCTLDSTIDLTSHVSHEQHVGSTSIAVLLGVTSAFDPVSSVHVLQSLLKLGVHERVLRYLLSKPSNLGIYAL